MKISQAVRVFLFNGKKLADINPSFPVDRIKAIHAATHPELATATVSGPVQNGDVLEYTFARCIGAKG